MNVSFIIENNIENKFSINIPKCTQIKELKHIICKHQQIDETFFESHFDLIYNEFILNDNKILQFYKIKSGDEIWIGKIENYLQKDEIILEVFIIQSIPEWMYLVVNMHCTIAEIIDIIERVIIDFHNLFIWDKNGNYIFKNKVVSEIDKIEGYHKILINCESENNTFFECCEIHDRTILENYSANYQDDFLLFENCYFMFQLLVNPIKDLLNFDSNDYLNQSRSPQMEELVSNINISFQNIKFLFCTRVADRIFYICKMFWNDLREEFKKQEYLSDSLNVFKVFDRFDHYFRIALLVSILTYLKNRENSSVDISIGDIKKDSCQYLNNPDTNWNNLVKWFLAEFILDLFNLEKAKEILENSYKNSNIATWKAPDGNFDIIKLLNRPCTVQCLKKVISRNIGVNVRYLYAINLDSHKELNDEGLCNNLESFEIQIIFGMDDIKILKELGSGAFGKVLLCEHEFSKNQFALKIPKKNKSIFSDIYIHIKLNKSNEFGRFYGLFEYKKCISIAIEYFSEGSLTSRIKIFRKPEDQYFNFQLAKIVHPILKQLKFFHDNEIIHGDMKCDNVVFDNNDCAKLIDFGLSKCTKGLSKEDLLKYIELEKPGTPIYMAPELLNNESYSYKVDIWSFGVMMVEMVLGKSPYINNPFYAFVKIANSRKFDYKPLNSLSPELQDFIDDCLESEPDKRATVDKLLESEFLKKNLKSF